MMLLKASISLYTHLFETEQMIENDKKQVSAEFSESLAREFSVLDKTEIVGGHSKEVLLVEDEDDVAWMVESVLSSYGFSCTRIESFEEACHVTNEVTGHRAPRRRYQAVVLDRMLGEQPTDSVKDVFYGIWGEDRVLAWTGGPLVNGWLRKGVGPLWEFIASLEAEHCTD